jgi:hypothetical protein
MKMRIQNRKSNTVVFSLLLVVIVIVIVIGVVNERNRKRRVKNITFGCFFPKAVRVDKKDQRTSKKGRRENAAVCYYYDFIEKI